MEREYAIYLVDIPERNIFKGDLVEVIKKDYYFQEENRSLIYSKKITDGNTYEEALPESSKREKHDGKHYLFPLQSEIKLLSSGEVYAKVKEGAKTYCGSTVHADFINKTLRVVGFDGKDYVVLNSDTNNGWKIDGKADSYYQCLFNDSCYQEGCVYNWVDVKRLDFNVPENFESEHPKVGEPAIIVKSAVEEPTFMGMSLKDFVKDTRKTKEKLAKEKAIIQAKIDQIDNVLEYIEKKQII